jgi:hypothetical protein
MPPRWTAGQDAGILHGSIFWKESNPMRKDAASVLEHFNFTETTEAASPPLRVLFINREGDPEPSDGESLPETTAAKRLRRALLETGQLRVMPRDGASWICFTGIGDPGRLFVESLPADLPAPSVDFDGPGRLCSLAQAEAFLRRLYRGESSSALAGFLEERRRPRLSAC